MIEPENADIVADLDSEMKELNTLEGIEGISPDHLGFVKKLAAVHASAREDIRKKSGTMTSSCTVSGNGCNEVEGDNSELQIENYRIDLENIDFDREILKNLIKSLFEAVDGLDNSTGISAFSEAGLKDPKILEDTARGVFPGVDARDLADLSRNLDLPVDAILLMGRLLASPFVKEARIRRGNLPSLDTRKLEKINSGRCPSCGSVPAIAVLGRDDGQRRLICSLCEDSWTAPRLMCPSCGNSNQEKLGTLCTAEDDPRWIEICDSCHRYIKTVDEKNISEDYMLFLRVEDVRSMYLDLIAEEEGYFRTVF